MDNLYDMSELSIAMLCLNDEKNSLNESYEEIDDSNILRDAESADWVKISKDIDLPYDVAINDMIGDDAEELITSVSDNETFQMYSDIIDNLM